MKRSRLLLPAVLVGWGVIAYGAWLARDDARDAHPFALLVHVVAFDLGHDIIIVPAALLVGWIIGRIVPAVARGPVRAALAVSAILTVFAYPLIRRWGQRPTNSSTLPLPYGRNLAILLAIVWLVAGISIAYRAGRLPLPIRRRGDRRDGTLRTRSGGRRSSRTAPARRPEASR